MNSMARVVWPLGLKHYVAFLTLITFLEFSSGAQAACIESKTENLTSHVSAGRAYTCGTFNLYACSTGDDVNLGFKASFVSATLHKGENAEWYSTNSGSCGGSSSGGEEVTFYNNDSPNPSIVNISGKVALVSGGNYLLRANSGNNASFPRTVTEATTDTILIPPGSTIKYAFLYYGGSIALKSENVPGSGLAAGKGDFTPDNLDSVADARANTANIKINGGALVTIGPDATPAGASAIGSDSKVKEPGEYHYGTLTNAHTSYYQNRVDITGLISGLSGTVTVEVNPPFVDLSANGSLPSEHDDNLAGNTQYNECAGLAHWSVVVIYEDPFESEKQIQLKDNILWAWDYPAFHKGHAAIPEVIFDHSPITDTAAVQLYLFGTGEKAGGSIQTAGICSCGCGGIYNLAPGSDTTTTGQYWSNSVVDPIEMINDPLHRDSSNGPWKLIEDNGGYLGTAKVGNDWTTVTSGSISTILPNMFEGENVSADAITPVTKQDLDSNGLSNISRDTYGGHPWNGRATVVYNGTGPGTNVLEVTMAPSAITADATQTTITFQGDQRDVFKPQAPVYISYVALVTPIAQSTPPANTAPAITLNGSNPMSLTIGESFVDPGATVTDQEDGTSQITGSCNVNILEEGTYFCVYNHVDSGGEPAAQVTRTIEVTQAPPGGLYCGTDTTSNHMAAGRAATAGGYVCKTIGGGDQLPQYTYSCEFLKNYGGNPSFTIQETSPGFFEKVTSCP